MTEFSIVTDTASWQTAFEQRLRTWYGSVGFNGSAVEEQIVRMREELADWTVVEITADAAHVGHLAVGVRERNGAVEGRIGDLWVEPALTGLGHEQAARAWAENWCAEQGTRQVFVRLTRPNDLFADYPVRGQTRMRVIDSPAKPANEVTARSITEDEYPAWLTAEQQNYISDIVRSGSRTPEEAKLKSDQDFERLLPEGLATPDHTILALEAAGEVIGTGWLNHGFLSGVTFGYSLEVHQEHRGKGYGRDAMAVGERATVAGGDSALMFNVFGGNLVAMNLYTTAGYAVVDEIRSIELPAR